MGSVDRCKGRRLLGLGLAVAGLTLGLVPLTARAGGMIDSGAVSSWINMVSASQDAQPHWMTSLLHPVLSKSFAGTFMTSKMARAHKAMANAFSVTAVLVALE
jgi:hypothetical protein